MLYQIACRLDLPAQISLACSNKHNHALLQGKVQYVPGFRIDETQNNDRVQAEALAYSVIVHANNSATITSVLLLLAMHIHLGKLLAGRRWGLGLLLASVHLRGAESASSLHARRQKGTTLL